MASPTANPVPEEPKTVADEESTRAIWTTVEGLFEPPISSNLRGPEPKAWYTYISQKGQTYPLSVVKYSEPATLTEEQHNTKKKAAEMRTPHTTVGDIEVVIYSETENAYLISNNVSTPFPSIPFPNKYGVIKTVAAEVSQKTGLIRIERKNAVEDPQGEVKISILAVADSGTPKDNFSWRKIAEVKLNEREAEIMALVTSGDIHPLCVIGDESGRPPSDEEITSANILVKNYQKQ